MLKKGLTFHPVKEVSEVFNFMFKLDKSNNSKKADKKSKSSKKKK